MKILEKIIKYAIYATFLLPLVFTSRTMYPWNFGKTLLFQAVIEVLILLALFYFGLNKEKRFIKLNKLDWLILAFGLAQVACAIFGVNFTISFWGDQSRAQGVFTWLHFIGFYFLIRSFFLEKKDWQNLGIWILIISFISSLIAFFGKYFSFFDNIIDKGPRISGMIGNPLFFAGYIIIPVFFGFAWFFLLEKENKWRWLGLFVGIVNLIALLLSQIRGAFIGLIFGLFIFWLFYLIFGGSKKVKKYFLGIGMVGLIVFITFFVFNRQSDYLKKNYPGVSRMLQLSPGEATANTRIMAWEIVLKGFADKPIFGWGPENYQDAFDKHYNPDFLKYSFQETVWDKPHNFGLEILNDMGIVGFGVYFLIIIFAIKYLIQLAKKQEDSRSKIFYLIILGCFFAYIGQNSFGIETSNSLQVWFFFLALISYLYSFHEKDEKFITKENIYKAINIFALAFIVLTPYLIYKNYTFYEASVAMGDARDYLDMGSTYQWTKHAEIVLDKQVPFVWEQAVFLVSDLSQMDSNQVLNRDIIEPVGQKLAEIYEKNIKKYPTSYLMRFWGGQLYSFMAETLDNNYYQRSDDLLKEAWEINKDRQAAGIILSKSYLLQGKYEEAVNLLSDLAIRQDEYSEIHWSLGLALQGLGREEEAIAELEKGLPFAESISNNLLYMIDIYAERQEYDKIVELYKSLINSNPSNVQYYASLAATYKAMGDKENAIYYLNKAVEIDPRIEAEANKFLENLNDRVVK